LYKKFFTFENKKKRREDEFKNVMHHLNLAYAKRKSPSSYYVGKDNLPSVNFKNKELIRAE
jgi:hypothetical protein